LAWWFKQDVQKGSKILDLVTAVMEDLFKGIGKPEPLKYLDAEIWLRRIDLEHRFVYRVRNTQVDFLACRYHYE
jgi:toxin YoeB